MRVAAGDYAGAVSTLEAELCNHGNQGLRLPTIEFQRLQQAVEESEEEAVRESMKVSGFTAHGLGASLSLGHLSFAYCILEERDWV